MCLLSFLPLMCDLIPAGVSDADLHMSLDPQAQLAASRRRLVTCRSASVAASAPELALRLARLRLPVARTLASAAASSCSTRKLIVLVQPSPAKPGRHVVLV